MMERVLALDHGEKRIGLAISDPLGMTAQALPFLPNDSGFFDALKVVVTKYNVQRLIVGLPLALKGHDTAKTTEVRAFVDTLKEVVGLEVIFRDERFSTTAVTRHLIEAGVSREKRKHVIDSQSAAFVLQGYLDQKGSL